MTAPEPPKRDRLVIRPYRPADHHAVSEICVRTAMAGGDARGAYSDDALMPDVYARPYLAFAPDLAFVADDGGRVVGYVLGVADTDAFVEWWRREWLPEFRERHPEPGPPTDRGPAYTEAQLVADGRRPERMRIPELAGYPAHLHVDLLPEAQGRGLGRSLIDALRSALAARGVPGVHLSMDPANVGARAFYDRLGFVELPSSTAEAPVLGIATS
ncbi:acetyltransferase [Agromyces rhizosphaerae]|uniref:Acetyltransferase n=1 Tax=Agromyces rhizosphaerae TaxID=88374 RepID=A0A9W6FQN0_9MICO|nr:GNAT family N-acetyltransferase [Agromyces rhizosphaerae]GLI26238.1 acetyltransferase [Agromyces rhizosphaerae]